MLPPLKEGTKPTLNRLVDTLNLAKHLVSDVGKAVSFNRPKLGPNKLDWGAGAAAPLSAPKQPIFGERAPLGFLTWAMAVFCEDTMIWFGFGLILPFVCALICLVMGLVLWACVEWCLCFISLHILSLLCVFPQLPSCKW